MSEKKEEDEYVDEEISIGDYVLSGGEIAATVLIDSIVRNLPGALGNEKSLTNELWKGSGGLKISKKSALGRVWVVLGGSGPKTNFKPKVVGNWASRGFPGPNKLGSQKS